MAGGRASERGIFRVLATAETATAMLGYIAAAFKPEATKPLSPVQKSGLDACGIGTLKPTKSWALFSAQMPASAAGLARAL
jgi:hypothetical protein